MNMITTTDETKIYFKDWGTGQPVVFSHGWPLNADAWDAQMLFLGAQNLLCNLLNLASNQTLTSVENYSFRSFFNAHSLFHLSRRSRSQYFRVPAGQFSSRRPIATASES